MRNLLLALSFLLSPFFTSIHAGNFVAHVHGETRHIAYTDTYPGDRSGSFRGDLMVILDDGSAWKIHPNELEVKTFEKWNPSDFIHVGVRTKWYWFKREHKFQLVNETRNEKIKVMLVEYPYAYLQVAAAETYLDYVTYTASTHTDSYGNTHTVYTPYNHYAKQIILSDGSRWKISESLNKFCIGDAIYVGAHTKKNSAENFLISGFGKSASWTWAKRL